MYHFCTFFDRNYLARGLTLYTSLQSHAGPFTLWVLCFDDFTHEALSRLDLPGLRPVSLPDFERGDVELLKVKPARKPVEYYFTCTPSWPLYILNNFPEVDLITYVDADLFFYSSPAPIYEELGEQSVLIVGHRFPAHFRHFEELYGIYNVGLLAFRNDRVGVDCLRWWRERCLEWCYDRAEGGRFADQKYLDDWPARFRRVAVLRHKGAGLAPWNLANYQIRRRNGQVLVDDQPLIFYHFHGLKLFNRWFYDPQVEGSYSVLPPVVRVSLYGRYVRALKETARRVRAVVPEASVGYSDIRRGDYGWRTFVKKLLRGQVMIDYHPDHGSRT